MVGLEWTECALEEPMRGTIVSPLGIAWIYDGHHVFVIPIEGRRIQTRSMRAVERRQVKVIGILSASCLASLRKRMADLVAVNYSARAWDHEETACRDDDISMPGLNDGYCPMGYSDGCYWRVIKNLGGSGER